MTLRPPRRWREPSDEVIGREFATILPHAGGPDLAAIDID